MKRTPELLEISEKACAKALLNGTAEEAQICASMFVLGPVLFAFVSWVLKQAKKSGKRRLYFLARDGWLMYRMAQSIFEAGKTEKNSVSSASRECVSPEYAFPECRYLYASRYAWRLPEQHLIGEKSLERICRGGMHVTFSDMMRRAGLTAEEAKRIAGLVCPDRNIDEVLSWGEIQRLRAPLSRCGEFRTLADYHSRSRYEAAIAYLSQEGLLEEIPWALVDSGWIGTMQESLAHLLESAGYGRKVEGYYFGLYSLPETADRGNYHAWYFEPGSGINRKAHFSNCLFECIFTAPHGMTLAYEQEGRDWRPELARLSPENEGWVSRQMELLELYMETLMKDCGEAGSSDESAEKKREHLQKEAGRLRVQELLAGFMSAPSMEESRCYGSVSFSDDVTEVRMQPLAARLTARQLLDHHPLPRLCLMLFPGKRKLQDSGWIEGSIRLYGGSLYVWHRAGALLYKYALYAKMQHGFRKGRKAA